MQPPEGRSPGKGNNFAGCTKSLHYQKNGCGKEYAIVGLIEYVERPIFGGSIGHYIAYVQQNGGWICYDDYHVGPAFNPPFAKAALYLLEKRLSGPRQ